VADQPYLACGVADVQLGELSLRQRERRPCEPTVAPRRPMRERVLVGDVDRCEAFAAAEAEHGEARPWSRKVRDLHDDGDTVFEGHGLEVAVGVVEESRLRLLAPAGEIPLHSASIEAVWSRRRRAGPDKSGSVQIEQRTPRPAGTRLGDQPRPAEFQARSERGGVQPPGNVLDQIVPGSEFFPGEPSIRDTHPGDPEAAAAHGVWEDHFRRSRPHGHQPDTVVLAVVALQTQRSVRVIAHTPQTGPLKLTVRQLERISRDVNRPRVV